MAIDKYSSHPITKIPKISIDDLRSDLWRRFPSGIKLVSSWTPLRLWSRFGSSSLQTRNVPTTLILNELKRTRAKNRLTMALAFLAKVLLHHYNQVVFILVLYEGRIEARNVFVCLTCFPLHHSCTVQCLNTLLMIEIYIWNWIANRLNNL